MRSRIASLIVVIVGLAPWCATSSAAAASPPRPPQRLAQFDLMPKPAALPDGTLAAFFIEHDGPGLPPPPHEQRVFARYSSDGGRTWGEPQTLFALPSKAGGFGYFERLVDRDGEVHFFIMCDANTGAVRMLPESVTPRYQPIERQSLDVWHVRSTAGRTRWSEPRPMWKGRGGDLQSVTQLRSGRIILPLSYFVNRNWGARGDGAAAFTYNGQFECTALYSDNGGATWQQSSSILRTPTGNLSDYGAVEPVVIERKDGTVWMLIRTQLGRFYESFSRDAGVTWTPAAPTAIGSSDSPAGLLRLADGRILIMWNNCQRFPYSNGARNVLHAAVSDDEGRTWRGRREILRDPLRNQPPPPSGDHGVSYPFLTQAKDGRVIYSLWVQSGTGRTIESFDPNWLTETEQTEDFTTGLDDWSTFGTKGTTVAADDKATGARVLSMQRVDPAWTTAAVRNFPAGRRGSAHLKLLIEPGFGGLSLHLTDHFSVPMDLDDQFHSAFNLNVGPDGELPDGKRLEAGQWVDLELQWDCGKRTCRLIANGKELATLPQLRETAGPSYLRLRATSAEPDKGRLLVERVRFAVSDE